MTTPNSTASLMPVRFPCAGALALVLAGALTACGWGAAGYAVDQAMMREPVYVGGDHQAGELYAETPENQFHATAIDSLATFSLDVDTASYTIMRRDIRSERLPVPDGVRIEEYINFFRYPTEGAPRSSEHPFDVQLEGAPSFFGDGLELLRVGVHGESIPAAQRPPTHLVFLIDVSGSMMSAEKIGLVRYSLTTLVDALRPDDTIGIVVYAGSHGVLLDPTPVAERGRILGIVDSLVAGGSTHGEAGIRAAYDLARSTSEPGGINRVVLCTDGDFNVGVTGDALIDLIEAERRSGVTLTVLGFGRGNINDRDMERMADRGNGSYAYIDSRNEALRVLQRDLAGTLQVVARDVKVQVAFNPDFVSRYRLIGYDNRVLADVDFDDDTVDAAEIGSGQGATVYLEYELRNAHAVRADTVLAEVRLRYQEPGGSPVREVVHPVAYGDLATDFSSASAPFRFGASVAELAEILRHSQHSTGARFDDVVRIAREADWDGAADGPVCGVVAAAAAAIWRRNVSVAGLD